MGKIETLYSAEIWPEDRGTISLSGDLHSIASDLGQLSASLNATLEPNNLLLGEFLIADGRLALPEADVTGLKGQLTYQLKTDDPSTIVADGAFQQDLLHFLSGLPPAQGMGRITQGDPVLRRPRDGDAFLRKVALVFQQALDQTIFVGAVRAKVIDDLHS